MMGAETACCVVVASLVLPSTVPARAVVSTVRRGARRVALTVHRFRLLRTRPGSSECRSARAASIRA
jgi:hypothetical protein